MALVLDVSNWDRPTFDAQCFKRHGVTRLIINTWRIEDTAYMLTEARKAGILVEDLYVFPYFGLPHERRDLQHAFSVAKRYGGIKRIWIDVEATPPFEADHMTPERRIQAVREMVQAVQRQGLRPGIYTGAWYWGPYMAGTTEFSHLPLWHAEYGPDGKPARPIRTVSYGGWTKVSIHQYTSQYEICGRRRDANYWFLEEDEMTPEEMLDAILNVPGLRNRLIAKVMEEGPIHIALDDRKRVTWRRTLGTVTQVEGGQVNLREEIEAVLSDIARQAELGTDDLARALKAIWLRLKAVHDALDPQKPPQGL